MNWTPSCHFIIVKYFPTRKVNKMTSVAASVVQITKTAAFQARSRRAQGTRFPGPDWLAVLVCRANVAHTRAATRSCQAFFVVLVLLKRRTKEGNFFLQKRLF